MRILTIFTYSDFKRWNIGSELLNSIKNKILFKLHAPGYHFLSQWTKLGKRLATEHVRINPVDKVVKEHDIWHRDHQKIEGR